MKSTLLGACNHATLRYTTQKGVIIP